MKYSILAFMIGSMICAIAQASGPNAFEVVVKYGGTTREVTTSTGIYMEFAGKALPSGDVATFFVNNVSPKKKTYSPDPKIAGPLATFKAGDLIDIIFVQPTSASAPIAVQSVKAYKPKVGEDDPNGYVFVETFTHKSGGKTVSAITLSKYTQKITLKVPMHLDSSGDLVVDDVFDGISSKLRAGEVVYATTTGSGGDATIKLLAPWANHFTGKFVKLDASATVDTNNDTGPAVELMNAKGKPVTVLIAGAIVGKKWVPDPAILESARKIKPDAEVDYLIADSGDKRIWLVTIQPSKPAPTTMASGTH